MPIKITRRALLRTTPGLIGTAMFRPMRAITAIEEKLRPVNVAQVTHISPSRYVVSACMNPLNGLTLTFNDKTTITIDTGDIN